MSKTNNFFHFPNIYFIGAQKCGTSTLYNWLRQDKRFSFPKNKETHYFSSNYNYGSKWYISQFYNKNYTFRCEIDPSYIFYPDSIKKIYEVNKYSKIIIVLRQPLERAYSHFLMSKHRCIENLSFINSLENEKNRILNDKSDYSLLNYSYLSRSTYSKQIEIIFKYFDDKNCLFIKYEDIFLNHDNNKFITTIYNFIGLEEKKDLDISSKINLAKTYKNKNIQKLLYEENLLRTILNRMIFSRNIRYKIKLFIDKLNNNIISHSEKVKTYNDILSSLPEEYILWNNEEVEKTQKLINLDLSNWII